MAAMKGDKAYLTAYLDPKLADELRAVAEKYGVSQSRVIGDLLAREQGRLATAFREVLVGETT